MAELKTKKTKASVVAFLNKVADPQRRKDCQTVFGPYEAGNWRRAQDVG